MLLRTTILCLIALPLTAFAQVHSLRLAFEVNSPYGISEPWYTIRSALLRCPEVQSVAERPDLKAKTGELVPKDGRLPDVRKLQQAVLDSGAGAKVSAVEATVEGELIARDKQTFLRLADGEILLRAPERLAAKSNFGKRWRVTGPLQTGKPAIIEVQEFSSVQPKK